MTVETAWNAWECCELVSTYDKTLISLTLHSLICNVMSELAYLQVRDLVHVENVVYEINVHVVIWGCEQVFM